MTLDEMRHALGIPWATERVELTEAIPPAYTLFIGEQLARVVSAGSGLSGADARGRVRLSGPALSNVEAGAR